MSEVFGFKYADAYDFLYKDKDYLAECRLIDRLFQKYANGNVRKILDLGCGTGNHALALAEQGYEVVGVDLAAGMLEAARRKAANQQIDGRATFYEGDLRNVDLDQSFDAALMMFAVLGYQLTNSDVLAALRTTREHVRPGGLLIFDVWYGPAVLRQGPSERVKFIPTENGQILRVASGELEIDRHLCKVSYRLWRIEGERLAGQTEETHWMRYFFPLELNLFLECSGFTPVRLGVFPEFDQEPDITTWNVLGIARAA
ncbi:MAG: class I SAM-dependent DNA methyltransferase [Alphaproteobacteria bacterium]